ncbi:DNA-binding transcriptional LysR family regulator [Microterricola gilva]|uniref:DNA-binding transcriptional LysR family regulator n=1 Tax=Microterricola gilva TaxID=393267 RepID=A0A4V2GB49_9MICO|nr:LysR substrate-binding domain-containing protein [Microterricola gilva]RZU66836.1 DNA-binding transcriptional LysR family regulator [Microterricola gilva]
MLDVRRLRLLREVKLRGTLAAVADALAYSPSSVSQQLTLLEKEVGVPLLEKSGRRVLLTPQAELLVARAAEVLDTLERAEGELAASLTTVSGTVRLAVFQSAAHAVIPQALTILAADYPELRVEMTEREPDAGLFEVSARDFDLVIAEQYPDHTREHRPDLDRVHLVTDVIRLATARRVASRNAAAPNQGASGAATDAQAIRTLAEAAALPWVMEPEGTAARAWATQLCRAAGFEPDVRFETADLMAHIRLIRSGNAVGLLPDLVWAGENPTVRLLELPGTPHRDVFTSARRSSAERPGVSAVREALARAVAELSPA